MECNDCKAYLISLTEVLKEYAIKAKRRKDSSIGTKDEDFTTGYLAGFHRIITLMQQQAESFNIPLKEIGLDNIKENDLI